MDQLLASHVAVYVHAGGMLAGAILGLLLPRRRAV